MAQRIKDGAALLTEPSPSRPRTQYTQGLVRQLLEEADIVRVLEEEYDMYLEEKSGTDWLSACCPLPSHDDSSPSFGVNPVLRIFSCFGCISGNELIWTSNGLSPMRGLRVGDQVLDSHGRWVRVILKLDKGTQEVIEMETSCFRGDPLALTKDHTCLFVRQEEALECLPYLRMEKGRGIKFYGRLKAKPRSKRYLGKLKLTSAPASDVKVGDYIAFPVIGLDQRKATPLSAPEALYHPVRSPRRERRIEALPATEGVAWLCGIWLAEGSLGRGYVRFTLHENEQETHAAKIVSLLEDEFGLSSSIYYRKERPNTVEVNTSSTDLAAIFEFWFGKGAAGKRLPSEVLSWPVHLQAAMIQGYRDGDGTRGTKRSVSVSRELSYGLYSLCIQAGENPSLAYYEDYIGNRDDIRRSEKWLFNARARESKCSFRETIDGVEYYLSAVTKCNPASSPVDVYDITVDSPVSSFTTKLGSVHNCGRKGDLIQFIRIMDGVSFPEAIQRLMSITGIGADAETNEVYRALRDLKYMSEEFLNIEADTELPGGMSLVQYHRSLSDRLRKFEEKVESDPEELAWVDSIYTEVDRLTARDDQKGLTKLWDGLTKRMLSRISEWREKQKLEMES